MAFRKMADSQNLRLSEGLFTLTFDLKQFSLQLLFSTRMASSVRKRRVAVSGWKEGCQTRGGDGTGIKTGAAADEMHQRLPLTVKDRIRFTGFFVFA